MQEKSLRAHRPASLRVRRAPPPLQQQRHSQRRSQKKQKPQRVICLIRNQFLVAALPVYIHKRRAQQVDARQKREQPDAQPGKASSAKCGDALPPVSRFVGHFFNVLSRMEFYFLL